MWGVYPGWTPRVALLGNPILKMWLHGGYGANLDEASTYRAMDINSSFQNPLDGQNLATTSGLVNGSDNGHSKNDVEISGNLTKLRVLHVNDIPLECHYNIITTSFGIFGQIKEIRMNLNDDQKWEAWITYDKHEAAFKACSNINTVCISNAHVIGALTDKAPSNLDSYKPSEWVTTSPPEGAVLGRTPKPPMWLVVTAREENYNYYKFSKYLQKMVGGIKSGDISRFGNGKVLIHTGSKTQSQMLSHFNAKNDSMIKDIKPHLNFSYGRGVIFDRDLYQFEENEILDMSPPSVCKVKKIPKTSMIILFFEDPNIPSHVVFENERVKVRPFHPKPLQCYNCYEFGHPHSICKNAKICNNCSAPEHGSCSVASKCANCKLDHKSTDEKCQEYK